MERDKNLYMFMYRMILTSIYNGTYKYQEKLPALASLCKEYHVGRNTLRSALLKLQEEGYITLQKGIQAIVIFNVSDLNDHRIYRQRLKNTFQMSKNVYETLEWIMPDIDMECLRKGKDRLHEVDELLASFTSENIHDETQLMSVLNKVYEFPLCFLNNSILVDLFQALMAYAYQPLTPQAGSEENLHNSINNIRKGIFMLLKCVELNQFKLAKNIISRMVKLHAKQSLNYVEKLCTGLEVNEDVEFVWVCNRSDEYLYAKMVFDILNDIAIGKYHRFDILPSISELSQKYDVSDRTTRKALSVLREFQIIETINGVGSRVGKENVDLEKQLLVNKDVIRNLKVYRDCLETFTILLNAVMPSVLTAMKPKEYDEIVQEMKHQRCKTLAPLALYLFAKTNRCLYTIYLELEKTMNWCVLVNMLSENGHDVMSDMRDSLMLALHNHATKKIKDICNQILNMDMERLQFLLQAK